MSAISSQFYPTNYKEAISDHRLIKPVVDLAKKIQTFVADIFYTFCYFAFPSMRSRPFEIWGRSIHLNTLVGKKFPNSTGYRIALYCGNQAYSSRPGKSFNAEELEHWFENTVTYANRVRPFLIDKDGTQEESAWFGKKTNIILGTICFQSRGKTPNTWWKDSAKVK